MYPPFFFSYLVELIFLSFLSNSSARLHYLLYKFICIHFLDWTQCMILLKKNMECGPFACGNIIDVSTKIMQLYLTKIKTNGKYKNIELVFQIWVLYRKHTVRSDWSCKPVDVNDINLFRAFQGRQTKTNWWENLLFSAQWSQVDLQLFKRRLKVLRTFSIVF